jgi:hypothetical protein
MEKQAAIFEEHEIRRIYDEKIETWLFSIVDIVKAMKAGAGIHSWPYPPGQPSAKDE